MDVPMPHLIAQKMFRRVQFRHACSESVTEIVIFEIDGQRFFNCAGMKFHGVNCLNFPVG